MKKVTFIIAMGLITVISNAQTTQYYDINVRTNPFATMKMPPVTPSKPANVDFGTPPELNSVLRISSGTSSGMVTGEK